MFGVKKLFSGFTCPAKRGSPKMVKKENSLPGLIGLFTVFRCFRHTTSASEAGACDSNEMQCNDLPKASPRRERSLRYPSVATQDAEKKSVCPQNITKDLLFVDGLLNLNYIIACFFLL